MKKETALAAMAAASRASSAAIPPTSTTSAEPPWRTVPGHHIFNDTLNVQGPVDGPLNAVWFPHLLPEFVKYPVKNTSGDSGGLPNHCTGCGPEGCRCSNDSVDGWPRGSGTNPNYMCLSCQDTSKGMICFCTEDQVDQTYEYNGTEGPSSLPCRLNHRPAGNEASSSDTLNGTSNNSPNGINKSSGVEKRRKIAGGTVAAAAGAAAMMAL